MNDLTDKEIDILADKIVTRVRSTHHEFWIDPEIHYNDHKKITALTREELYDIQGIIKLYKTTKGLFFKAFLGAAVIGAIVLAALGLGFHK